MLISGFPHGAAMPPRLGKWILTAGALAASMAALAAPVAAADDTAALRISGPHVKDNLAVVMPVFAHAVEILRDSHRGPHPV